MKRHVDQILPRSETLRPTALDQPIDLEDVPLRVEPADDPEVEEPISTEKEMPEISGAGGTTTQLPEGPSIPVPKEAPVPRTLPPREPSGRIKRRPGWLEQYSSN